ncbi:thiol reductant ABC exporter subunit CydD [Sulfobacillus harzensis]|uniref:Thiol reductant ABC exporter subunit CydD n=1 Tax=Sulfobacillus harzensis TaxID=2729629 RepID=A0A7Y0L513_9FIRM|nr:thiol reductant ABC exporter subunit CydD [Sulfobacillus harzensis]NMP23092.1 thiol reductant ABC exporter subunit CydD [Sulfobacillus harzensis]
MDFRLFRRIHAARQLMVQLAIGGALSAILSVAQAALLAHVVSQVYIGHATLAAVRFPSIMLLAAIALRALLAGANENWALRGADLSQMQLRQRFVAFLLQAGPMADARAETGALTTLAIQGIDEFEVFLAQYFPQVIVTAAVPAIVWIGVMVHDWISGLLILLTLPLIPLFMYLIGRQAETKSKQQVVLMSQLNGHFLDVLHGLDTLKLFGRSREQTNTIYRQSEAFRASTMATLQIAFLSGMVLELIASLSMAFVAVAIGLRLIHAALSFETAFMVLVLVPEFYIPWRNLGAKFHEGLKGATAAQQIFDLLDASPAIAPGGETRLADPGPWTLVWQNVSYTYPGQSMPALHDISLSLAEGDHLAIVGPSGSGKSTLIQLLLGATSFSGAIQVAGVPLETLDIAWWRRQMSWVTQHPYLFEGTILDNLQRVAPKATRVEIQASLVRSGAWDFIQRLPKGWDTEIGQEGLRLSGGQRQRLALARAFLLDTPIVIFDEPTQNLDLVSEEALLGAMDELRQGRTAITIAHRLTTVANADRVLVLRNGEAVEWGTPEELAKQNGLYRALVDAYRGRESQYAAYQADPAL